jgi:hypothetical protein
MFLSIVSYFTGSRGFTEQAVKSKVNKKIKII